MRRKVSILESECGLPTPASGSITISAAGGSIVTVGNITGSIVMALDQTRPSDEALANVLAQLSQSIEKSNEIGEELRQSALQKLDFVARQAAAQPVYREQASIIESVWNGLVVSLSVSADIAQICSVAAPLVARHFS